MKSSSRSHFALRLVVIAVLFALGLVLPVRARAAQLSNTYVLTVATDRPDAIYHQGETVTFNLKLLQDGQPVDDVVV